MAIYRTVQGDTWDVVSLKVYNSQLFTHKLIAANTDQMHVAIFGAGVVLNIPVVTLEEVDNTNLPPWRR